jgi:ceramide synthetase
MNAADYGSFPTIGEILYPAVAVATVFGLLRTILTVTVFAPFARFSMKLEEGKEVYDEKINRLLLKNKTPAGWCGSKKSKKLKGKKAVNMGPSEEEVLAFCKEQKYTVKFVNDYLWERRRNEATQMKITKFVEALWRFIFYSIFCVMGIYGLFYNPNTVKWISNGDTYNHWKGWPFIEDAEQLSPFLRIYYIIELGCYLHQLYWTEVTRSDAVEMIIHHLATIMLIGFSWLANFTRIGTSILLVHDLADIFLESGKCVSYASKAKGQKWLSGVCDTLFAVFAVTFGVTRLYFYPKYLVSSLLFESTITFDATGDTPWAGYYIFGGLLVTLQVLHIFWFYLIMRMVYQLFTTGIDGDVRSDDEDEPEADKNDRKKTK